MSARTLERIKLGFDAATGRPSIYRHGSNVAMSLESRDATFDVVGCFIHLMMHGTEKGQAQNVQFAGGWYRVGAFKIDDPTPKAVPMEGTTPEAVITEKPADVEIPQDQELPQAH